MRTRLRAGSEGYRPVRIGPFQVLRRLGAGSMGEVFLARSVAGRLVAVKTIRAELAADPDFRRRFVREVAAAQLVSGAFTAPVVDADPEAELPWLATVYLPAPSLAALVAAHGPLPVPAVRWLAAGCAEALAAIHRVGLVHRDLKPANVLVTVDGPRVIDFGLAHTDDNPHGTRAGTIVGTPSYMAPEQARGHKGGPSADVFALGATVLFAAVGRPPHRAATDAELIHKIMNGTPDLTGVPEDLHALLAVCLARDPAARPTTAELLDHLTPFLAGADTSPPLPAEALTLIQRHPHAHPSTADDAGAAPDNRTDRPDSNAHPLVERAKQHRAPHHARRPGPRRGPVLTATCLAAAGLLALAYGPGRLIGDAGAPGPAEATGAGQSQQPGGPPGFGPPGQPPPDAVDQIDGHVLTVFPPAGDQDAVFVLRGTGWPPGQAVTVSVVGGKTAADKPVVDSDGDFTYAVNQGHEFFPDGFPSGVYQVRAVAGTLAETVDIAIGPPPQGDQPSNP